MNIVITVSLTMFPQKMLEAFRFLKYVFFLSGQNKKMFDNEHSGKNKSVSHKTHTQKNHREHYS